MRKRKSPINEKGQALTEMILSIPLLFIFAAALIQFAVLFLSSVQFEHACGEAARQYAAGLCSKNSIQPVIFENLGVFKRYFDPRSFQTTLQPQGKNNLVSLDKIRKSLSLFPFLINYDSVKWRVSARCRPPFLFHVFFPDGVLFKTTLEVDRYPQ